MSHEFRDVGQSAIQFDQCSDVLFQPTPVLGRCHFLNDQETQIRGAERDVSFESIECPSIVFMYALKGREAGSTRHHGCLQHPTLPITSRIPSAASTLISRRLDPELTDDGCVEQTTSHQKVQRTRGPSTMVHCANGRLQYPLMWAESQMDHRVVIPRSTWPSLCSPPCPSVCKHIAPV